MMVGRWVRTISPRIVNGIPLAASLVLALLLATLLIISATGALAAPPFTYLDVNGARATSRVTTYQPERASLCGGAPLRFRVSFDVTDVPVTIANTTAIRSRTTGRAVPGTLRSLNPPVPYAEPAQLRNVTVAITLPVTIVPDSYVFVFVASAAGRQDNAFQVPFTVPRSCVAGASSGAASTRAVFSHQEDSMTVRAKFWVEDNKPADGDARTILLRAVYGDSDPKSENSTFWRLTPSGTIQLSTINAAAAAQFTPGSAFYVTFEQAD